MTVRTLELPPTARRHKLPVRQAVVLGTAIVLLGCVGLIALAWRASNEDMIAPPARYAWTLASYPALARVAEPMRIRTSTGVTLQARFFPGRERATVVVSGGYGGTQDEMLPVANSLHAAGLTVVTYSERGTGGSGGQGTWGALETKDLRSVIDAIVHHPGVDTSRVAEFGFSIGADITILEAASDPRVKAVVADGSWPSLRWYMKPRLSDIVLHPTSPYSPLALELLELRTGADLGQVDPAAVIARISPRPILLMDGLEDRDVTPRGSLANYALARAPRSLWLIPGEGHEQSVQPGGAATWPRVANFFTTALLHTAGS